ncbi:hypothetical protein DFH09DRAFT_1222253 [Mycena vulgaris]|nr:hypothetical protein DFH09DRAFT_1222253 [Mycena vulgaris]
MLWTAVACLKQFIHSIVWAQSITNFAPWRCEICASLCPFLFHWHVNDARAAAIRIILGTCVGIPASSLCIVRQMYLIASMQSVTIKRAEVRFPSLPRSASRRRSRAPGLPRPLAVGTSPRSPWRSRCAPRAPHPSPRSRRRRTPSRATYPPTPSLPRRQRRTTARTRSRAPVSSA